LYEICRATIQVGAAGGKMEAKVDLIKSINEDLERLDIHEVGMVYKYIRTNIIANLPAAQKIKERTANNAQPEQWDRRADIKEGALSKLSEIKLVVSEHIDEGVMVVGPKTCAKLQQWFGASTDVQQLKQALALLHRWYDGSVSNEDNTIHKDTKLFFTEQHAVEKLTAHNKEKPPCSFCGGVGGSHNLDCNHPSCANT
jgi:hypothetical protein